MNRGFQPSQQYPQAGANFGHQQSPYGGSVCEQPVRARGWNWWAGCGGLLTGAILISTLVFAILAYTTSRDIRNNSPPQCFKVFGSGIDEVDSAGDRNGIFYGVLKIEDEKIDWKFDYQDFGSDITNLYIAGPISINDNCCGNGTAGPWALLTDKYGDVQGADKGGYEGTLTPKDELKVSEQITFPIMAYPDRFYVRVATREFPEGAARGNIGERTSCDT